VGSPQFVTFGTARRLSRPYPLRRRVWRGPLPDSLTTCPAASRPESRTLGPWPGAPPHRSEPFGHVPLRPGCPALFRSGGRPAFSRAARVGPTTFHPRIPCARGICGCGLSCSCTKG